MQATIGSCIFKFSVHPFGEMHFHFIADQPQMEQSGEINKRIHSQKDSLCIAYCHADYDSGLRNMDSYTGERRLEVVEDVDQIGLGWVCRANAVARGEAVVEIMGVRFETVARLASAESLSQ